MPQCESAVVYDGLPISSGGAHGLGRIGAHNAYAAWSGFLEACTSPGEIRCYFDLPDTPELKLQPHVHAAIDEAFPAAGKRHPVPVDRIEEALTMMSSFEPQPTNPWGMAPVWLTFSAEFALLAPDGQIWPHQDRDDFGRFETATGVSLGTSLTTLNLESRRSMGLMLSVPNATDAELARLVPWLQSHLPFRLSSKHWSRWVLAKNGRTYRGRKLAA